MSQDGNQMLYQSLNCPSAHLPTHLLASSLISLYVIVHDFVHKIWNAK